MITVLEYLVIAAVIGLVVFGIAVVVFGRGEQLAALSPRTSPSELPEAVIAGDDVHRVRFGLALRGYRMSDVDWTLDRLADELDRLHRRVAELGGEPAPPAAAGSAELFEPRPSDPGVPYAAEPADGAEVSDGADSTGSAGSVDSAGGADSTGSIDGDSTDRGDLSGRHGVSGARAAGDAPSGGHGDATGARPPGADPGDDQQWAPRHRAADAAPRGDDPGDDPEQRDMGQAGPSAPRP